jgi:hypothetical protein
MALRATALGCTQIATYAWFTGEESSEVGEPREQNHAIATGKGKQCSSYPLGNMPGFLTALLVPNVLGGSGAVQRKYLQLPFDGDRRWQVTHGLVASLILEGSGQCEDFALPPQRTQQL